MQKKDTIPQWDEGNTGMPLHLYSKTISEFASFLIPYNTL